MRQSIKKALELNPDNEEIILNQGIALVETGRANQTQKDIALADISDGIVFINRALQSAIKESQKSDGLDIRPLVEMEEKYKRALKIRYIKQQEFEKVDAGQDMEEQTNDKPSVTLEDLEIPENLLCPINNTLMLQPAMISNGQTFEKDLIQEYFENLRQELEQKRQEMGDEFDTDSFFVCPVSGDAVEPNSLQDNEQVKQATQEFLQSNPWAVQYDPCRAFRKVNDNHDDI